MTTLTADRIFKHLLFQLQYISKLPIKPSDDQQALAESAITKMMENGFTFDDITVETIIKSPPSRDQVPAHLFGSWELLYQQLEEMYDWAEANALQDVPF